MYKTTSNVVVLLSLVSILFAHAHGAVIRIRDPDTPIRNVIFGVANPNLYNRSEGGGRFVDRLDSITGNNAKILQCNNIVSFFIGFDVDSRAPALSYGVEFDVVFESDTTGESGMGYEDFLRAELNEGDPALVRQAGNEHQITYYQTNYGTPLRSFGSMEPYIVATIRLEGLVPEEKIVLRLDARLGCAPDLTKRPSGNIHASLDKAVVVIPVEYEQTGNILGDEKIIPLNAGDVPVSIVNTATETTQLNTFMRPEATFPPEPLAPNECYCSLQYVPAGNASVCMDYVGMDGNKQYCHLRPCKDSYKHVCTAAGTDICVKVPVERTALRFVSFKNQGKQEVYCESKNVTGTTITLRTAIRGPEATPVPTPSPTPAPILGPDECYCRLKYVTPPSTSICMDYKGIDRDGKEVCQTRACKDAYKQVCDVSGTEICVKTSMSRQVLKFLSYKNQPTGEAYCEYKTAISEVLTLKNAEPTPTPAPLPTPTPASLPTPTPAPFP